MLTLRVRVPPTTGFLMYYWHSPTVVIDQYTGDSPHELSPEWLKTVQKECRFWQSRTLMLEMMLYFARNIPHNSRVLTRVSSWCSAMSVSNIFSAMRVTTYEAFEDTDLFLSFTSIPARFACRHKLRMWVTGHHRVSDLSADLEE
jgi:hypothetical protein